MAILRSLMRGVQALNYGRAKPEDPSRIQAYLPVPLMPAGVHLTMETALQLGAVWACIDAITKALVCSPWRLFHVKNGRRERQDEDNLVYLLNKRPNPDMTAIAFKESLYYNALSWGNGYAEIVRDGAGRVAQLWPLMPDRMTPRRNPETWEFEYVYQQYAGDFVVLPASAVFHLKGPGITGLMGDNMIARMAKAISLAVALERFASTYFGNNTIVGGMLKYPKALDDKTYERLKQSWEDRHKGPDKANKPVILEGGMDWVPFNTDASKAQAIEARKFSLEEIARFYGVPLHKIQHIDRATFNNIEHLGIEFVRDALTPWAVRAEQEADYKLVSNRPNINRETKIDTAWLSYGDAKSRAEAQKIWREMGVMSANDICEMEGRNHIGPEGDVRYVPLNMQTLGQMLTAEETAEAELENLKNGDTAEGAPPGAKKPSKKGKPGEDAPGPETPQPTPAERARATANMVNDAMVTMFASVMDRYARRLRARSANLSDQGWSEGRVAAAIALERERMKEEWVPEESKHALDLVDKLKGGKHPTSLIMLCEACDHVHNGEAPREAAAILVAELMKGTNP